MLLYTVVDCVIDDMGDRENTLHIALESNSPTDILESIIKR